MHLSLLSLVVLMFVGFQKEILCQCTIITGRADVAGCISIITMYGDAGKRNQA